MKTGLIAIFVASMGFAGVALAGATVQVHKVISYAENTTAPQKVIDECELQNKIPAYLSQYARKAVALVDGEFSQEGRRLELEISGAHAPGGGAWSGPKSVEVLGKLYEGDTLVGDFVASRYSTGGMWGGFKGTCSIAGRCAKAIAKDISVWLKKPTMDARLGDSQ
jgi:hypothetical protein